MLKCLEGDLCSIVTLGRFFSVNCKYLVAYHVLMFFVELPGRFYGVVTKRSCGFLQSKSYLRMLKTEHCYIPDTSSKYCRQN